MPQTTTTWCKTRGFWFTFGRIEVSTLTGFRGSREAPRMVDTQLLVGFPLLPQPHSEGEAEAAVGSQALCVIFM